MDANVFFVAAPTPSLELTTINSMLRVAQLLFFTAAFAPGQDFSLSRLQGRWTGALNQGILNLRVAIQFDRNGAGKLQVLDQQAPTIAVTAAKVEGYRVTFRVDSVGAYFNGIVMNDGNRLDGEWHQGATLPFVLARDGVAPPLRRPQTPQPPFPYTEQNVKFASLARGIFLDATLSIPPGPGPFPAVYLITGSGPQDRDETNLGHKPFRVMADYLARRGVVVLRADDRGTGKSNGDFSSATTRDFADAAAGAVQFLKSREFVSRIGLIGHSEGGIIAPMVASDPALGSKDVDFLVLLDAPGVTRGQGLKQQQDEE